MKETICTAAGIIGSFIAGLFGGFDASMVTLIAFMAIDYVTGLIVAAVKKSPKTETGGLSSRIGLKGLAKKCVVLLLVLVAARLDITLGTSYIRSPLITIKATFNSVTAKQQSPKLRKRADFRGIYDNISSIFLQKGMAILYYTEARFKNSYLQKL